MDVSDPLHIVAVAGAALAVVDLVLALWFLVWMRRVRHAQRAILRGEKVDLVEFAVGMQALVERAEARVAAIEEEVAAIAEQVDEALTRRAIVRYDALRDGAGNQSASVALLDGTASGIVLSAIQGGGGSDVVRVFVKEVVEGGAGSIALTPEEAQAVQRAGE